MSSIDLSGILTLITDLLPTILEISVIMGIVKMFGKLGNMFNF